MFRATPPFWPTATVACCAGRRCIAVGIAYYVVVSSILPELQAITTIGYRGEGSAVQFRVAHLEEIRSYLISNSIIGNEQLRPTTRKPAGRE